jgi:hypothetical protein
LNWIASPSVTLLRGLKGTGILMSPTFLIARCLLLVVAVGDTPHFFDDADAALLAKFGGIYIPTGEGPLHRITPVDQVIFDSSRLHALNDDEFSEVLPAVVHMDPYHLRFEGQHKVTDNSIEGLSTLQSIRLLDVDGTEMTLGGLKQLKVNSLKFLRIPPEKFSAAQLAELQQALPGIKVEFDARPADPVVKSMWSTRPGRVSAYVLGSSAAAVLLAATIAVWVKHRPTRH